MQPPLSSSQPLLALLGPTASGKTSLAVALAHRLGGLEILSADSRQLYIGMDIGTGKDLEDYTAVTPPVAYHLIDLVPAGCRFNLFLYLQAYYAALERVYAAGNKPLLCGGSGLYAEAILRNYPIEPVPKDPALHKRLAGYSQDRRVEILSRLQPLHNTTDTRDPQRTIRAIEIALAARNRVVNPRNGLPYSHPIPATIFALHLDAPQRRAAIDARLIARLKGGLIEEVQRLLDSGLSPESLIYYGLEYRYVTEYLMGQRDYQQMLEGLSTAIHQFAKRQMTYLRGMERRGLKLHWLDASKPQEELLSRMVKVIDSETRE